MALKSTGRTHWDGDLLNGSGVTSLDSGAAAPMQVTWKARSEESGGLTSPEELIASAHASCYAMAFASALAKNETPPTSIDVEATVTFVPGEGITLVELSVAGIVEGMSEPAFVELAETAKNGCPVSQALAGNVPVTLEATLAG